MGRIHNGHTKNLRMTDYAYQLHFRAVQSLVSAAGRTKSARKEIEDAATYDVTGNLLAFGDAYPSLARENNCENTN